MLFQEPNKPLYYLQCALMLAIPDRLCRARLGSRLAQITDDDIDAEDVQRRVDYYIKLREPFDLDASAVSYPELCKTRLEEYHLDLRAYFRYFPRHFRLAYEFGDVRNTPPIPTITKSRPIHSDQSNANAVLMKLNRIRHFFFVKDRIPFSKKLDRLIFRGAVYREPRKSLVPKLHGQPRCDVGQTNRPRRGPEVPWYTPRTSIADQLKHKFVLSIEGNDVATNLKWIMHSNSLCFMPKPRFETWFMEGLLEPGVHYVQIEKDGSDVQEKIDHYARHIDEAEAIIANAQAWTNQFLCRRREFLIGLLVLERYFQLSGQLEATA